MEPGPPRDRISDLFHRALGCTPEARPAFLEEACAGDAALRGEVESLLRFESDSARFLETPAALALSDLAGAPDRSQMIGRQLGPYTIVAPVGAGGMGEVYRARDSKLGRDVAIKILPPHFTADPERRARFAREARLLATLNHPHIGAIYGLEESDGVTALVLELVEGPTLAQRLERGPLPIADAVAIARQIAEALDTAHEKDIIHRDLKPANVVLQSAVNAAGVPSGDVRAKVLDFGLAKTLVARAHDQAPLTAGGSHATADGRILGTPAYMSPEQARGEAVDKRTDIWAFGCVLYEMLAGRRAFEGKTITDTLAQVLEREPDWAVLPNEVSPSIRTLLERCLRKDPRKRLHDIADARIELDESDGPDSSADSRPNPASPHRRRERIAWFVVAALSVLTVATTLLYLRAVPDPAVPIQLPIVPPQDWSVISGGMPAPSFEISPDGQHLVVAADSKGVAMLWVSPILTPAWRQLEGTEDAGGFFWSPDSRHIGFFAANQLKRVALSGGAPEIICPAAVGQVPSGAWSGGDVIVFGGSDRLWKVAASGGKPTPVSSFLSGETGHRWPSFLPDNDHFLYLAQTDRANELRIGSLTATDTVALGAFDSNARYVGGRLIFVRGERLVSQPFDPGAALLKDEASVVADEVAVVVPWGRGQFSVSGTGVLGYSGIGRPFSQLTWKNPAGHSLSTVGEPGYYLNLDLDADNTRVAASRYTKPAGLPWNGDIWTIDLARNAPRRLTTHPAREFDPAWSHDGTDIAFFSSRPDGEAGLFRRSATGSGEDERLASGSAISPDWSPERVLVYTAGGQGTGLDLWTLPVSGDRKAKAFLKTTFNEAAGEFSPDGRWIAYQSDESGLYEVYVRPFPDRDNESHPISRGGGRYARWRGDGRELFFVRLDGMLMAARIDSTRGSALAVPTELFQTSVVPGANHPYAVSRDGQRFLVPVILNPPGATPITVVLNWMARLRE